MLLVQRVLPSPLTIAIFLTIFSAVLAFIFTKPDDGSRLEFVANAWNIGFWELLEFTAQMMLMLVLGHVIALSYVVGKLIDRIAEACTTATKSAVLVALFSILMGYLNWGLGLIFGAILARKVYESVSKRGIPANYPLLAACGYLSLLVWHGGMSGSAPLTIAKSGHSTEAELGVIPISETIFSPGNLLGFVLIVLVLPTLAAILSRLADTTKKYPLKKLPEMDHTKANGAERVEHISAVGFVFGLAFLSIAFYQLISGPDKLSFFNLDSINFMLFGFALCFHGKLSSFLWASEEAIKGSTGILIQFPLYAGVMGIVKYTGLLAIFSNAMLATSTAYTFPFWTFFSASLVNILVPSGGAQWQVQGPILIDVARQLGVPMHKAVMSLVYGDQLTNMLQPFWALPLLGITGLKAREILPYSALFMLVAGVIYLVVLYAF